MEPHVCVWDCVPFTGKCDARGLTTAQMHAHIRANPDHDGGAICRVHGVW